MTKRLRFPYRPTADESLCGAFVSACHDSRMRSPVRALIGGGLRVRDAGSLQLADPLTLAAIAKVMRVGERDLQASVFSTPGIRNLVMLGDLTVSRNVIELRRRRIGPVSISLKSYHRASWLNRLLPYCPESLELLVDACPTCGPLGWKRTRGIGHCDVCAERIEPSSKPCLSPEYVEEYRQVANLMSHNPAIGATAVERLPSSLHQISRTTLVQVLLRSGVIFSGHRTPGNRTLKTLASRPAPAIAKVMSTGMRMLLNWPRSIRDAVDAQTSEILDDTRAYEALRADLKWLSARTSDGDKMLRLAFPTIDGRTADTFAAEGRYYTATEVNNQLNIASKELKSLRDVGAIRFTKLPSAKRLRARYHVGDVDALKAQFNNCMTPGAAAVTLDVPVYAVEQIAAAGHLIIYDQPGIVAVRGVQIESCSVSALLQELGRVASVGQPPPECISLRSALSCHPGEKPWGQAISAMLGGRIPFYLPDAPVSLRRILIDPRQLWKIALAPEIEASGGLRLTHISLRDTYELFVAGDAEGTAALKSAGIGIRRYGAGKGVSRIALRKLMSEIAFVGEAAALTGRGGIQLHHEFVRLGIPRIHGAWSRKVLADLGFVRRFEHSTSPEDAASCLSTCCGETVSR